MTRSRLYLYIIAGGYLAYTGFGLVKNVIEERPGNYIIYLLIGILFVLVGGVFAVKSVLQLIRDEHDDPAIDSVGQEEPKRVQESSGGSPDEDSDEASGSDNNKQETGKGTGHEDRDGI